ncbi:MAG: hypothetical protein K6B64_02545 [Acholeplasmatales bacterium]|nr:hypothetical protein [Acholeplasmatales bacterium]
MQNNPNQNIPESVWADGVPKNIEEKDIIKPEELHSMAIDYVMKKVILPKGFKIEQGFPRRDFPNIVMKRDGVLYMVVVYPSVFPNYVTMTDEFGMKIVEGAKKFDAVPLYAPVGYKSIDQERAKASLTLKGDVFQTTFPGFIKLTDAEKQDFNVKPEELFRP